VDLSASMGVACWPTDAQDADLLMSRAEIAMHAAKSRTAGVLLYAPTLDSSSSQTLSLLSDLRHALAQGELRLFLQPKVAVADETVVGAEALVRWQHPQRGLVPPLQFIPFAEQTGFVRQLTLWMFEEAARQWQALQPAQGQLRLSINLSTRDLLDPDFPLRLSGLLVHYGLSAQAFCLEITESAIMDDPQRAEATLGRLAELGFKLSIDDFGTGYSSLAYLKRLPVDELKIDKSFVMGMAGDESDAKIVRSTVDLAHNLGLSVVAEGVEDQALLLRLRELRCDEAQGYHIARPMPAAEFVAWRTRWEQARTERAQA
jgi:EAL domain-containing protein (putative c-di-GMP-specific phosphodiesterase class I)